MMSSYHIQQAVGRFEKIPIKINMTNNSQDVLCAVLVTFVMWLLESSSKQQIKYCAYFLIQPIKKYAYYEET